MGERQQKLRESVLMLEESVTGVGEKQLRGSLLELFTEELLTYSVDWIFSGYRSDFLSSPPPVMVLSHGFCF